MTKQKGSGPSTKYAIWRSPVRTELLSLESLPVRPVQRSNTLSRMMRTGRSDSPGRISPDPALSFEPGSDIYYPLSFNCHGKHGASYTLYASTIEVRNEWRRKMLHAISARKASQESSSIFRLETISASTTLSHEGPAHHSGQITGRASCTLPFGTTDGRRYFAIGSEDGVWIGMPHHPSSFQRVIPVKMVTQIAFLAEFGLLVVLADRIVHAIDIESVVPSPARDAEQPVFGLQRISNPQTPIHFFSVGRLGGETFIISKKRKALDSVFKILKVSRPVDEHSPPTIKDSGDFFLPSDTHDLLFLKTKVCILCTRGFEIMDLSDFSSATIPLEEDLQQNGKRPGANRPIAMHRIREDEFLLCYDGTSTLPHVKFGLYVDKRGAPSRSPPIIEWEGVAAYSAWHAPYVVLFHDSFIEVRHVESGRLAQIISGHDIRCVWDGRGVVPTEHVPFGYDDFDDPRTPRIHAVLDHSDAPSGVSQIHNLGKRQRIVELVPTDRLVTPGTRYSPSLLSVADTLPPYTP
ncbi:CNH-domain-containing protein [Trametes coccinea BRFM310]|uniref:CNH-domain-containing protein n=1 Tax=Trametes coccinea (strain BRFM310) TaxID=1353009 RepID=A0A1Y2IRR7_TRAC3|nr:CNH-domain-containing protein [Trametes coccinea BRFM310]